LSKEAAIENAIGDYLMRMGARLRLDMMIYDVSSCAPLSAATIRHIVQDAATAFEESNK